MTKRQQPEIKEEMPPFFLKDLEDGYNLAFYSLREVLEMAHASGVESGADAMFEALKPELKEVIDDKGEED